MTPRRKDAVLVGPYGGQCGIGQYAEYLWENLRANDPGLKVDTEPDLHPQAVLKLETLPRVVILNYQAALLSQWHPAHIKEVQTRGAKVLTIWHDSGVPNSDQCKAICAASDHFILHEPYEDLPAHGTYLRQGVPAWEDPAYFWYLRQQQVREGKWWFEQPVVGTVGLSLGYRNIDLLCKASYEAGWGVLVVASKATDDEVTNWTCYNPAAVIIREFLPKEHLVSYLAGCDATAQLTVTNNAGTSGAIRQCLAARKPLIAFKSRQFRDLEDELAIQWLDDGSINGVADALENSAMWDRLPIVRLAHRDSWTRAATVFGRLIRDLSA